MTEAMIYPDAFLMTSSLWIGRVQIERVSLNPLWCGSRRVIRKTHINYYKSEPSTKPRYLGSEHDDADLSQPPARYRFLKNPIPPCPDEGASSHASINPDASLSVWGCVLFWLTTGVRGREKQEAGNTLSLGCAPLERAQTNEKRSSYSMLGFRFGVF
ncbi:hypothetical protein CDAR_564631 [Caerostris darwini]|uniref:Uncharacterized protein n=1 Tax=Caerostris darwini TaxID=1538125 RepID=A0AAV4TLN1_9ARAC|nr:hypothetical protein CDAR_564631 [Caerostris darwini]